MLAHRLGDEFERDLEDLIRERLGNEAVRAVRFVGMRGSGEDVERMIEVEIAPDVDPTALGRACFGLTSSVRRAMGDRLTGISPDIVPTFAHEAHA